MLKSEKTTIGPFQVTVQKHPVFRGLELKARIAQFIGPALSPMLQSVSKSGGSLENLDMGVMAAALGELFFRMDPTEVKPLICEILSSTQVVMPDDKGQPNMLDLSNPAMIEVAFSDKDKELFQVVWFAIKVNFTGLFPEGSLNNLMPRPADASQST